MADPIRCPRDGAAALAERHEGRFGHFDLHVCPTCSGVWFDRGEISKLVRDRKVERMIVDYASGDSRIRCPRCGAEMAARPIGDITVDVCPKCNGVWFDRSELQGATEDLGDEASRRKLAAEFGFSFGPGLRARDLVYLTFYSPGLAQRLLDEAGERAGNPPDY